MPVVTWKRGALALRKSAESTMGFSPSCRLSRRSEFFRNLLRRHFLFRKRRDPRHSTNAFLMTCWTGRPITDEEAGPITWSVWMREKQAMLGAHTKKQASAGRFPRNQPGNAE